MPQEQNQKKEFQIHGNPDNKGHENRRIIA